jgi:hypothetical protein
MDLSSYERLFRDDAGPESRTYQGTTVTSTVEGTGLGLGRRAVGWPWKQCIPWALSMWAEVFDTRCSVLAGPTCARAAALDAARAVARSVRIPGRPGRVGEPDRVA